MSRDQVLRGIEYAYLLRFQLTSALLLAVGLPAAYFFIPSLAVGLFDGLGFWSFAFIALAAFQLAWTVMVTFRLVLVYGPDRFNLTAEQGEAIPRAKTVGTGTVVEFALLAVPLIALLFYGTDAISAYQKLLAIFLGLLAAFFILLLTASLQFFVENEGGSTSASVFPAFGFLTKLSRPRAHRTYAAWGWCAKILAYLPPDLTKGYLENGQLRSGHEMAIIMQTVFLMIYVILGIAFSPSHTTPDAQPAALFFLLSLITIFTWFLSGAAFFLDKVRLPVWVTLLAISLLTGAVRIKSLGTDHIYPTSVSAYGTPDEIRPFKVVEQWRKGPRHTDQKTVTVIATAGGGIRAAAWTAEVVTRLQEQCGPQFSSTLLLVSSVSGGSLGSMFVVDAYDSATGAYPSASNDLRDIRENASQSSLGAVGWGLAYPDLARTTPFFGPLLVSQYFDRGWALEHAWSSAWKNQEQPLMSDWRVDTLAGKRPAVIFNATASESGERFLVSSSEAKPLTGTAGTRQFFELFSEYDISVPTAARLSATFPYVSPLSRLSFQNIGEAYHVGDGGYYDNSGLMSVVEWLSDTGKSLDGLKVMLIIIDAAPGNSAPAHPWSWQHQMTGPIETLLHVRSSSQSSRDALELEMAKRYLKNLDQESGSQKVSIEVEPAPFLFAGEGPSPLSWHLTSSQLTEIHKSWDLYNADSKQTVYKALGCPVTPNPPQN